MKKYLLIILTIFLLISCGSNKKAYHKKHIKLRTNPILDEAFSKDSRGLDILTNQFANNIDSIWGVNELLVASKKDYVKYTDNFYTRSHISFEEGIISIESIYDENVRARLKNSLINTLLMGGEPNGIDLFASGDVPISNNPFLAGQVVDNENKPITDLFSAQKFADNILEANIKVVALQNGKKMAKVVIPMVASHVEIRAQKYLPMIRKYARKYQIDESLIIAIMKIESSFNPYAISYANAIGLMQIVPSTAGVDVFKKVKNSYGSPSKKYLFNPDNNIDAGTAYLSLLKNEYLDGVKDPVSLKYLMITSYNAGAGATLNMFDYDKEIAIEKINKALPEQIYNALANRHPSSQARNYIKKVTAFEKQIKNKG